jgi:hypothetical protein
MERKVVEERGGRGGGGGGGQWAGSTEHTTCARQWDGQWNDGRTCERNNGVHILESVRICMNSTYRPPINLVEVDDWISEFVQPAWERKKKKKFKPYHPMKNRDACPYGQILVRFGCSTYQI